MTDLKYALEENRLEAAETFRDKLRQAWEMRPDDLPLDEVFKMGVLIGRACTRVATIRAELYPKG